MAGRSELQSGLRTAHINVRQREIETSSTPPPESYILSAAWYLAHRVPTARNVEVRTQHIQTLRLILIICQTYI